MPRRRTTLNCLVRPCWVVATILLIAIDGRIAVSVVGAESGAAMSMKEARKDAANRRRRIIFNNDGNEPVYQLKHPSAPELLDSRTSPLIGSQVDSIFYCTWSSGFGVFTHFTKIGDVFTSKEGRFAASQMTKLVAAGIDPLQVMVDFCRKKQIEIFWSMRMNDTHDGSTADYGPILFRANTLKNKHPEYLLGAADKRPKYGAWTAVDYGRPEIRDLAFRYLEEVCRNYDIDGIELDFFRHPVFFQTTVRGDVATDEQLAAMTDLLKRVRTMADEVGMQRGRPILIAARTPDSVEYARAIGLDIESWMADDLIDLFIPAGYFQLNDWPYSVSLGHKHGIKVYPSLDDSRVRDQEANRMRGTISAFRGRATEAWAAGADGLYIFNQFNPQSAVWRELGEPEKLAALDKVYFGSIRGMANAAGGNLPFTTYINVETLNPQIPKSLSPGNAATARIQMGETFDESSTASVRLRLQFKIPPNPGLVQTTFNGYRVKLSSANGNWLEANVPVRYARKGANNVLTTLSRDASGESFEWTDVMLEVRH